MNYRERQLRNIIKKDYVPLNIYQQETNQLKKEWQQQLKAINILFDSAATHKEKIKFTNLYDLIVRYKEVVEKERETWRKKNK